MVHNPILDDADAAAMAGDDDDNDDIISNVLPFLINSPCPSAILIHKIFIIIHYLFSINTILFITVTS